MQTVAVRQLVRPMRLEDIPQVMEVEQQSFPTMWPPTAFRREIQHNRLARYLVAVQRRAGAPPDGASADEEVRPPRGRRFLGGLRHILQAEPTPPERRDELVVGFVGVWLLVDEAHIVTIAVRDGHRRRGVGELLVIAAVETALREGQPNVTLECRVSNDAALRLYEKYGFQRVGRRPRYYSDNHEDAFILTASGVDTLSYAERFRRLRDEHRLRRGDFELAI